MSKNTLFNQGLCGLMAAVIGLVQTLPAYADAAQVDAIVSLDLESAAVAEDRAIEQETPVNESQEARIERLTRRLERRMEKLKKSYERHVSKLNDEALEQELNYLRSKLPANEFDESLLSGQSTRENVLMAYERMLPEIAPILARDIVLAGGFSKYVKGLKERVKNSGAENHKKGPKIIGFALISVGAAAILLGLIAPLLFATMGTATLVWSVGCVLGTGVVLLGAKKAGTYDRWFLAR